MLIGTKKQSTPKADGNIISLAGAKCWTDFGLMVALEEQARGPRVTRTHQEGDMYVWTELHGSQFNSVETFYSEPKMQNSEEKSGDHQIGIIL